MAGTTKYTPELGAAICERLADGESLRLICADAKMPNKTTVWRWLHDAHPEGDPRLEFRAQYAQAREMQADTLAGQIIEIADDASADVTVDENGKEIVNHEIIGRSRLRVDARKWIASKLLPKVYGDKTILEGGDPDKPIRIMDPHERARRILLDLWLVDPATQKKWGFDPLKGKEPPTS